MPRQHVIEMTADNATTVRNPQSFYRRLSYATIDMAPTIRVREAYLGLFRPGGAQKSQHALEHQHKQLYGLLACHLMSFQRRGGQCSVSRTLHRRPAATGRFCQDNLSRGVPLLDRRLRAAVRSEREDRYQGDTGARETP